MGATPWRFKSSPRHHQKPPRHLFFFSFIQTKEKSSQVPPPNLPQGKTGQTGTPKDVRRRQKKKRPPRPPRRSAESRKRKLNGPSATARPTLYCLITSHLDPYANLYTDHGAAYTTRRTCTSRSTKKIVNTLMATGQRRPGTRRRARTRMRPTGCAGGTENSIQSREQKRKHYPRPPRPPPSRRSFADARTPPWTPSSARPRRRGERPKSRRAGTRSHATTTTEVAGSPARKRGGTASRPSTGRTRRTGTCATATVTASCASNG